jgi:hypothetical protein
MNLTPFENDRYNNQLFKLRTTKTIILNSAFSVKTSLPSTNNSLFRFNLRNLQIDDYSILKQSSVYASGSVGSNIYTFKTTNLLYNNRSYHNTDNSGFPTIATVSFVSTNYYQDNTSGLILQPQNIDFIEILATDSLSNISNGIASDIDFILTLSLEIFTPVETDVNKK